MHLPKFPKLEVTVEEGVDDEGKLQEFKARKNGPNRMECFIISETGKKFVVKVKDDCSFRGKEVRPWITVHTDGQWTNEIVMEDEFESIYFDGYQGNSIELFSFTPCRTTDGTGNLDTNEIGTIKVEVKYGREKHSRKAVGEKRKSRKKKAAKQPSPEEIRDPVVINEQAKKNLSHIVRFGTPYSSECQEGDFEELKEYKPRVFIFKYRSEELLIADNIIDPPFHEESSNQHSLNIPKHLLENANPERRQQIISAMEHLHGLLEQTHDQSDSDELLLPDSPGGDDVASQAGLNDELQHGRSTGSATSATPDRRPSPRKRARIH